MAKIGGAGPRTNVTQSAPTTGQPDGAATSFGLSKNARGGALGVFRKPAAVAAPAATVGVDVANAGPAQVALKTELDNVIAVVNNLRAIVNRSYFREDPTTYLTGTDFMRNIVPVNVGLGSWDVTNVAARTTDGNDATWGQLGGHPGSPGKWEVDMGVPVTLSSFRFKITDNGGVSQPVLVQVRKLAGDAWHTIYNATPAAGGIAIISLLGDAGPWRYVHVECNTNNPFFYAAEAYGAGPSGLTSVLYTAAPANGDQLVTDSTDYP